MVFIASIGTVGETCPGANALDGKYRSPCTRKSGARAAGVGRAFNAGSTYHFATRPTSTSDNVNCTPISVVGLIADPFARRRVSAGSRGPKPCERLLSIDEPLRGKDGGPLDSFRTGPGIAQGHEEREPADASGAVPRNDVGVTPLHDPGTERVRELGRVNEECLRSGPFGFSGEEAERRHETAVRHGPGRRQPLQFEDVRVIDDHAPLVVCHSRLR